MEPIGSRTNIYSPLKKVKESLNKLSSGQKINSAKDDAAGLQISNQLLSQLNGLNGGIRNANDGISYAQVADAGLSGAQAAGERIQELSIQAANGALSGAGRQAIQQEISQLQQQIGDIANNTRFADQNALSGQTLTIETGSGNLEGALPNIQAEATALENIDVSDPSGAQQAIESSQAFLDSVSSARADLGAFQNRLFSSINVNQINAESTASSAARIRDTDVAKQASEKAQEQFKLQAAIAVKAQANLQPAVINSLLNT